MDSNSNASTPAEFYFNDGVDANTAIVEEMLDINDRDFIHRINLNAINEKFEELDPADIKQKAYDISEKVEKAFDEAVERDIESIESRTWSEDDKKEVLDNYNLMADTAKETLKKEVINEGKKFLADTGFDKDLDKDKRIEEDSGDSSSEKTPFSQNSDEENTSTQMLDEENTSMQTPDVESVPSLVVDEDNNSTRMSDVGSPNP